VDKSKTRNIHRQFHVTRWRLDEELHIDSLIGPVDEESTATSAQVILAQRSPEKPPAEQDVSEEHFPATWFPLPADHLLQLIKENVFRGLLQNKNLVDRLTIPSLVPGLQREIQTDPTAFLRHSAILPIAPQYPGSLEPTSVQMSVNHFSWIDYLPCPTMRENLIRREFEFDHAEFVEDLVGTLINLSIFTTTSSSFLLQSVSKSDGEDDVGCMASTSGNGLVIWGEPYLISSWELTPRFLHKWGWTLVGCKELMESTNCWRASRGERPLCLL
jgi:hypothetical protein